MGFCDGDRFGRNRRRFYFEPSWDAQAASTEVAAAPPAVPVTVTTVQPRPVHVWREVSGRFEAVDRVELRSRVAGAIQAVHFREGGLVIRAISCSRLTPSPTAPSLTALAVPSHRPKRD